MIIKFIKRLMTLSTLFFVLAISLFYATHLVIEKTREVSELGFSAAGSPEKIQGFLIVLILFMLGCISFGIWVISIVEVRKDSKKIHNSHIN